MLIKKSKVYYCLVRESTFLSDISSILGKERSRTDIYKNLGSGFRGLIGIEQSS